MAPLRLPKVKSKGKTAPQPESHDDFMDAALVQENQATRYQFGEKARRHYEAAVKLYSDAVPLASDSDERHDALYNLARLQYALATEIYGIPSCYEMLYACIASYRQALTTQPDSTDAAFNLAQSLHTLGEWMAESPRAVTSASGSGSAVFATPAAAWEEARRLLAQVEQAQSAQLEQQERGLDITSTSKEDTEGESPPDATAVDAPALEETVLTPSTLIETLLTAVEIDISLLSVSSDNSALSADLDALLARARALDARDGYMADEITKARHDVLRALLEQQMQSGSQPEDGSVLVAVLAKQRALLAKERRPDPGKHSDLADTLVLMVEESIRKGPGPSGLDEGRAQLLEAIGSYRSARETLSSPVGRPSSIPAHQVPALLSANLASSAKASLLVSTMFSDSGTTLMQQAKQEALQALNAACGPFSSINGEPRFGRTPKAQAREDYRTTSATRECVLLVLRTQLLGQTALAGGQLMPEETRISLVSLLKATWPEPPDLRASLETYVEEQCRTSGLWLLSSQAGSPSEEDVWRDFVQKAQ